MITPVTDQTRHNRPPSPRWHRYPTITIGRDRPHVDSDGLFGLGYSRPIKEPPDPEEIELAIRWLESRAIPGFCKTPQIGSYEVKHAASRWLEHYVSNGALLIAADRVGFNLKPIILTHRAPVNARIGISWRWYRQLPESLLNDRTMGAWAVIA